MVLFCGIISFPIRPMKSTKKVRSKHLADITRSKRLRFEQQNFANNEEETETK